MAKRKIPINTKEIINPMIYAYTTPEIKRHDGWTKIGYTEQKVEKRLDGQTHTADVKYHLEWFKPAMFDNGEYFKDGAFHVYLVRNGIEKMQGKKNEWFHILPQPAKTMLYDFKENHGIINTDEPIDYSLRDEQDEAAGKAADYFLRHEKGQFLFNAKPRFGKTLTTYDLCKRMKAKNVLIVTNRPAIANSWYDDYVKFLGTQSGYHFVSTVDSIVDKPHIVSRGEYQRIVNDTRNGEFCGCIEFVSLQDLKGSIYFGGKYDKLKEVAKAEWDLLVIDEAHEGVDTYKTDVAFDHINSKFKLHLSGTPFKALANEKFSQDAIYNWTYADEQKKKREYVPEPGSDNPYAKLPQLNMFTYQLSEMIGEEISAGVMIDGENKEYAFDLNEFFITNENGAFKYNKQVDNFLDALTSQEKFPFSTEELRNELKHTLWLLNRVSSAKALANKLKKHPVFKDYEIVLAAGDGKLSDSDDGESVDDSQIKKAFDKVTTAIKEHDKTITISVGQLTTGVTIPEWTAVLMLSSIKSPALYMQAAFRAQNPCTFREGKTQYRKENAYVFDFDPARTLSIFEQIANGLSEDTSGSRGDSDTRKRHVRELLNFFPVIGEDEDGEMIELDAEKVLSIPRKLKSVEVVRRGFMSDFLFQNIGHIFNAPSSVKDMIAKLPSFKEPEIPEDTSDVTLDENGDVKVPDELVIGIEKDKFGGKIYGDKTQEELEQDFMDLIDSQTDDEMTEEEKMIDSFTEILTTGVVEPAMGVANGDYGANLSPSSKKNLERELKTKAETKARKVVGDHKIQTTLIEKEREERLEDAHTREDIDKINADCDRKKQEAKDKLTETLAETEEEFKQEASKTVIKKVESDRMEKKKKVVDDAIKDHLRGFTRTIPSFLMAYGDDNTELDTFEKNIPDNVFKDVTTIEKEEFVTLRDGGERFDEAAGKKIPFEGHVFDEVVFNDSVKEFMNKKTDLANYFDEQSKEDIFNYIPPQKNNQIFTPRMVVKNMVDLLEKENPGCFDDPDKSFADLYMKSGMYLAEIVTRLYRSEKMKRIYPDNKERLNHIFAKQVYGCAPTEIIYNICIRYLLGFSEDIKIDKHNIVLCDTLELAKNGNLEEELLKLFDEKEEKEKEKEVKQSDFWKCYKCGYKNRGIRTTCLICGKKRP